MLNETVETIDHAGKRFQYSIADDSPLPITGYLGTVALTDAGGKTALAWTAEFEVADAQRDEISDMLKGALSGGVEGLAEDLEASN